jgi:hypothetical protein
VADDVRDVAQAHIVEDLVDLNFGPDEPTPLLVFDEIGSRQDATAAALQMLVNAGLLTPDERLELYVRQATGLPSRDPNAPEPPPEPDAPPVQPGPAATGRRNRPRLPNAPKGAMTLWDE